MPTYAQLQAESWWNREIVTPELDWLGDEICRRTGRPRVAAGSKGDNVHLNGAHRSQEWIERSRFCTSRTYTVQSGLTVQQQRHIAGFDFTPGSDKAMIAQCKRLMAALRAGTLEEVREFYGNVDGDRIVDGWDNLRNRAASSDSSHLWHWHLSIDRRKLTDRKLMERILAVALGDQLPEEDDMPLTPAEKKEIAELSAKATLRAIVAHRAPRADGKGDIGLFAAAEWARKHAADAKDGVLDKLVPGQAAILAALAGDNADAITAKLEALAAEERQRDEATQGDLVQRLDQAALERAEIAELIGQAQSGQLDAERGLSS
jgi:hypothetical protein